MSRMAERIVVVGGGHAGVELAATLRLKGFGGSIDIISDDPDLPYQRPPLSKEYIKRPGTPLPLRPAQFYAAQSITLHRGVRAASMDRAAKTLRLEDGRGLSYDHLVLATGARNLKPNIPGIDHPDIIELRTLTDADRIVDRIGTWKRVAIIGGGFIGLEAAGLLSSMGIAVEVVELGARLMQRAVSPRISEWFLQHHRGNGVRLHMSQRAVEVRHESAKVEVELADGTTIAADAVVLAAGVVPNTALAVQAGLLVDNGIVVDSQLMTEDTAISAIGDCAAYPSSQLSAYVRLESVQNATDHARTLAASLVGDTISYNALPWFWSIQGEARLQIAGICKPALKEIVRGSYQSGRFSVFHFEGKDLRAVESVNSPGDHMIARRIIAGSATLLPSLAADETFDLKMLIGSAT